MSTSSDSIFKGDSKRAGFIHPESRKAVQMQREMRKDLNKAIRHKARDTGREQVAECYRWLKAEIERPERQDKKCFSDDEIVELLRVYVKRFDDELEDLEKDGKKTMQEMQLKLQVQQEKEKLQTGYEVPDLRIKKVVTLLREWDGENTGIEMFKLAKFKFKE